MNYHEKLSEKIYNNQRKFWEVINGLTNRNKGCHRTQELTLNGRTLSGERLVNVMNEPFINAGSYVATDGNKESTPTADKSNVLYSVSLVPTDSVKEENLI